MLITAIDAGQDVAACDIHHRIATYRTSLAVPLTWLIWHNTTTATKDIAVVGVAILGYRGTTVCIYWLCMLLVKIIIIFVILIIILRVFIIIILTIYFI